MIASLRRRHRRLWLMLACVLPLILLLAWAVRRPPQLMDKLPEVLNPRGQP